MQNRIDHTKVSTRQVHQLEKNGMSTDQVKALVAIMATKEETASLREDITDVRATLNLTQKDVEGIRETMVTQKDLNEVFYKLLDEIRRSHANLQAGQDEILKRVIKLEERVISLEERVIKLEERVTRLEERVTKLEERQAKLESGQAGIQTALYYQFAILAIVSTTLLTLTFKLF